MVFLVKRLVKSVTLWIAVLCIAIGSVSVSADAGKETAAQDPQSITKSGGEETPFIPKHNYVPTVTLPTCTEGGYTTYYCAHCGDSYIADYTSALGHDLIHHDAKTPTSTKTGWYAYDACTRCDYSTYFEIPSTANGVSIAAAQMSADGGSVSFIAAVDGLDYEEVGFAASVTDADGRTETVTVADKTVYKSLTYNSTTITSEDFGIEDGYLFVLVIENIPSKLSVSVTPFATETSEGGGARVDAQVRSFGIEDNDVSLFVA